MPQLASKNATKQRHILDHRFGRAGRGIYLLPIGIVAGFLSSAIAFGGGLSAELLAFGSPRMVFIWLLSIAAGTFFFVVAVGGCSMLMEAKYVLQRIDRCECIVLKPYLGPPVKVKRHEIKRIETVHSYRRWLPMTLLSRTTENWKIDLRDGRQYYVNGDLVNLNEFMR